MHNILLFFLFVEDPSNGFEAAPQYFERNNVLVVNYALHADYQALHRLHIQKAHKVVQFLTYFRDGAYTAMIQEEPKGHGKCS